jgi:hypothetical protein
VGGAVAVGKNGFTGFDRLLLLQAAASMRAPGARMRRIQLLGATAVV